MNIDCIRHKGGLGKTGISGQYVEKLAFRFARHAKKKRSMRRIVPFITAIFLIFSIGAFTAKVDINLNVDKTGWINPTDPLSQPIPNYAGQMDKINTKCECEDVQRNLIEENAKLRAQLNAIQSVRENSVDVLMKHVLRQFFAKLNIDLANTKEPPESVYRKAQVFLSRDELAIVRRYLTSEKAAEEFGLRENLRGALENFLIETDIRSNNSLLSFVHSLLPYILMLNILLLLPATFIVIRSSCRPSQLFFVLLIIAFGLSCYFTYIRKYQEVLAQRFERAERNGKNPCSPQGLVSEAFDLLLSYVTIKDKSECLKSFEDMLIEPFLLVDPLQVLAEVLSNFFLAPLSVAGIHMNRFFKHFFTNIPLPLALLMTIFIFLMPLLMVWAVLKIREHLARERRREEHEFLLLQNRTQQRPPQQLMGGGIDGEKERKIRRRALGQEREQRTPSAESSAAEEEKGGTTPSIRAIRQRIEERRKWE